MSEFCDGLGVSHVQLVTEGHVLFDRLLVFLNPGSALLFDLSCGDSLWGLSDFVRFGLRRLSRVTGLNCGMVVVDNSEVRFRFFQRAVDN
jgi:hypothetical protein